VADFQIGDRGLSFSKWIRIATWLRWKNLNRR